MPQPIITLTTDFGTRDGYVGALKGVLARRAPDAVVVDLAHDIPRGDIAHAAWAIATSAPEFPDRTTHLVIVDPGVGGARRGVVVRAGEHAFVGPDNGVFAYIANAHWFITVAWEIPPDPAASPTFHGRDVFAPAAAELATIGWDAVTDRARVALTGALPWGERAAGEGRVVHVDHYGNLITDLPAAEAGEHVAIAGFTAVVRRTYADVPSGELVAYVGSARTIEIAVRDGRADELLAAPRGTRVFPLGEPIVVPPHGPYR